MQRPSPRHRPAGGTSASATSRGFRPRSATTRWRACLPVSPMTTSCAFGPDPVVLAEMRRVTGPGGVIALINPEQPEWFEANGWSRLTVPPLPVPDHPPWLDEFFGPLDPPRELLMQRADA